jgi:hypothetical protein
LALVSPTSDTTTDISGGTAQPDGTTTVRSVSFTNQETTGTVRVKEYSNPPQQLRDEIIASATAAGAIETSDDGRSANVLSVVDITPTTDQAGDSAATVTLSVPADEVTDSGQLRIVKESYDFETQSDTWNTLETTVQEETDEQVTVTAEVDSFSLFSVIELPGDGEGQVEDPDDGQTGTGDDGGDDSGPGSAVIIGILLVVLAIAAAIGYKQMNTEGES